MAGGGEAAHVGADFGDDHLSRQVTDTRDGPQQTDRRAERGEITLHLRVDLGDRGIYYRIQAGPLADAAAQSACAELKRRKVACLLVKR